MPESEFAATSTEVELLFTESFTFTVFDEPTETFNVAVEVPKPGAVIVTL